MKKIILSIAVIATAAIAGWNYQQNQTNTELSDLALANIEALASGEGERGTGTCYHTITSQAGSKILYCATCTYIEESTNSWISGKGECK